MKRWPEVRAGAIAVAILFGLVDGCPVPPPHESSAGVLFPALVEPVRSFQHVIEWPVAWLHPTLRITQRWALYQAPGRDRFRMSIDGQGGDGAWRILYRAADPEHDEDAAIIEHARVWGVWDPIEHAPKQYPAFCSWITARMLAGHPELRAVRVRMEKIVLRPGGFDSTGEYVHTYVRGPR